MRAKYVRGGRYIAAGTTGCVFGGEGGPLKCLGNATRANGSKVVSKLMNEDSVGAEEYEGERWKALDPEGKFTITSLRPSCQVNIKNIKQSNCVTTEYHKCRHEKKYCTTKYNTPLEKRHLLFYKNGGPSLEDLKPESKHYAHFFSAFHPLLEGLAKAHDSNLVHLDIKPANLVADIKDDEITIRFIDFGLSEYTKDAKSYHSIYTENNHFYPWWPFEIGAFFPNGNLKPVRTLLNRYKSAIAKSDELYPHYGIPEYKTPAAEAISIINSVNFRDIKTTYEKVDVYSVGIVLLNLLYKYFKIELIQADSYDSYGIYYNIINPVGDTYEIYFSTNTEPEKSQLYTDLKLPLGQIQNLYNIKNHIINPLVEIILGMINFNPNDRFTAKKVAIKYEKLLPAFKTYLTPEIVDSALAGQNILGKITAKVPHVITNSGLLPIKSSPVQVQGPVPVQGQGQVSSLASRANNTAKPTSTGGFIPSIMGPFSQNAAMLMPLAVAAGYRLMNNRSNTTRRATRQVRKMRVQTRSKANLRRRR
jgi:serine/threonine protein kinase